jgi:hypothetical protein
MRLVAVLVVVASICGVGCVKVYVQQEPDPAAVKAKPAAAAAPASTGQ